MELWNGIGVDVGPTIINGLGTFGDGTNYTEFVSDGKIRFYGSAQPVRFDVVDSLKCDSTHHSMLKLTELAAVDGITTSGLDTVTGNSRRIELIGIDGGIQVKGRIKAAYAVGDTTHDSQRIKIKLNTTNTTWEQAGEWRIILDIVSGNVTGTFTIFMPAFSIMEYSEMEVFVACDGSTYYTATARGFETSVAGPAAASEDFSNNESAGSDVVVEVASTAGFYEGNEVFVSDSLSSEWARIKSIAAGVSITIVELTNSYTTANGAKFETFDYIRTVSSEPTQRGLFRTKIFKANINSGIVIQLPIPQQTDPTADYTLMLQYVPSVNNPTSLVTKWRVQYAFKALGDDISESLQYGTLVYTDLTPPATKMNWIGLLATITAAAHEGDNLVAFQLIRLGADVGDTYTGDIKFVAVVASMPWKQLGYEV